jgi:DNA replication protein DnaC
MFILAIRTVYEFVMNLCLADESSLSGSSIFSLIEVLFMDDFGYENFDYQEIEVSTAN